MTELITGQHLQAHLAKKRKQEEKKETGGKKKIKQVLTASESQSQSSTSTESTTKVKRTAVRPGCKKSKLTRKDLSLVQNEEELQDLRLLNYPSIEKTVTPHVTTEKQNEKTVLVIDFNRAPYQDSRFCFKGYSMVFLSRHVKHLATALNMASNVLRDTVPIFFDSTGIRIKKEEFDESTGEGFIFQVRLHHLLQYYCHRPIAFRIDADWAQRFAKHHSNQSGEWSVIWKFNRDDQIRMHLLNDDKNFYKHYIIPVIRNLDSMVPTPPLSDNELSWDMELEELSKSCDELNFSNVKDPSITFRIWGNAIEIFSENQENFHVFGMNAEERPVREKFQFAFHISLNCLRKVCSRMKKSKGQEKTLTISVDSNAESYVQFSQNLSDQITFEWWLSKRNEDELRYRC